MFASSAAERLLVTVGPQSDAEHLVRAAARLASRLDAEWTALYIETPALQRLPEVDRDRILGTLRLAEELGGKSVVVGGGDVASAVLEFARAQNISRILIGRARGRGWWKWVTGSTADSILAGADDLNVTMIGAAERETTPAARVIARAPALGVSRVKNRQWQRYFIGATAPFAATLLGLPMRGAFELANIVM